MEKLTADQYRKMAHGEHSKREESFDRCDTDGFLTQWASGLYSSLYQTLAELAENNWMAEFPALFYSDTNKRVPAKIIYVQDKFSYNGGTKSLWAIIDPETGKFTGVFLPTGKKSRKQKSLGFWEGTESAPAYAKIDGKGYGLSGSAWVSTYRTDGGFPKELLKIKKTSREEVVRTFVEYAERNFNSAPFGIQAKEEISKSGKEFTRIMCGLAGKCDVAIDVYGESFILVKISRYNPTAIPSFRSIDEAIQYMNYYLGI
jgi:hypothetical protein